MQQGIPGGCIIPRRSTSVESVVKYLHDETSKTRGRTPNECNVIDVLTHGILFSRTQKTSNYKRNILIFSMWNYIKHWVMFFLKKKQIKHL